MSTAESRPVSKPLVAVIMGVSGSGKSSVGKRLASRFDAEFVEGDDLHPKANVEKMARGHPLNDDDRRPWLDKIGETLKAASGEGRSVIVSCSALKKAYRDRLRAAAGDGLIFIHLAGDYDLLDRRMKARSDHFMPASLLESQFDTLEDPAGEEGVVVVSVEGTRDEVVARAIEKLEALA